MLSKVLKRRWVRALRSEKYQQGRGMLRRTNEDNGEPLVVPTYCCLGVLCEVQKVPRARHGGYNFGRAAGVSIGTVKGKLRRLLNEDHYDIVDKLIDMNDDQRCSFSKIADYIERTL